GELLDRMDLWDHIVAANADTAPALLNDPRLHAVRYKGSLYADRKEVDAEAIKAVLAQPGEMVIVDDPRGVVTALGRKLNRPSTEPVKPVSRELPPPGKLGDAGAAELLAILQDDSDWDSIPDTEPDKAAKALAILRRAEAAETIRRRKISSTE